MDRRKALRTIGFGTTAITVTPAVVGMLQACQSQTNTFTPIHFSKENFSSLIFFPNFIFGSNLFNDS